jgi:hypothetical protein
MPSRREFLQTGAVMSAMVAHGVVGARAEAIGAAASFALGRALYDDRYAEGRRFAAVAGAQGVVTRALDGGDVTSFYHELDALWRRAPVAIGGFTQFGPMFVVERFALERGLRLAMRVEHWAATDGSLQHRFLSPAHTLEVAGAADARHSDWPGLMATLAARVGADPSPQRSAVLATSGPPPAQLRPAGGEPAPSLLHYYTPQLEQRGYGPALDGPLYSWVVAPRAQRG